VGWTIGPPHVPRRLGRRRGRRTHRLAGRAGQTLQTVGGENDGKSRQLGRYIQEVAPFDLTDMNVRLISRRDRYLCGTDTLSFRGHGYAAARFSEPRENFNHEHQNTQVVNGVQFLQIHTTPPGTLAGINLTTLSWDANPESNIAGYEVVQRETTVPDWTSAIPVGNVTTVTFDISKDNVQFGLRAVDTDGNRSPVAFPQVAA
jgi:hypothetical protein